MHRIPVLLLLLLLSLPLGAQPSLVIGSLDSSMFPRVTMELALVDGEGRLLPIEQSDLHLFENGIERNIVEVSCPGLASAAISAVLSIDISGSMAATGRIEMARIAARAFIDAIDLHSSQCAITSFNGRSYFDQDFTVDKSRLFAAIDSLAPRGGTSYDAGLIELPGGAIPAVAAGRGKRIVLLLTDGDVDGNESAIIDMAARKDVAVYPVVLGMPAPQTLRNIARRTGGLCFDNIMSADGARAAFLAILELAGRAGPCRIEWRSGAGCTALRNVVVSSQSGAVSDTITYLAPLSGVAMLEVRQTTLRFGGVALGDSGRMSTTLIARGAAITLAPIISSDPRFTIISGGGPVTLQPNVPHPITVEFKPTDSGGAFTEFILAPSGCDPIHIYATGGFGQRPPSIPTLRIVRPNGGEYLASGADTAIEWTGVAPEDTVLLEYSTDGGSTWSLIDRKAYGLRRSWNVPNTQSGRCLVRVAQLAGTELDTVVIATNAAWGAFHPNERFIGTCAGYYHLYDAETGLPALSDPASDVRSTLAMEFSPDGKEFITVGNGEIVARVWNADDGRELRSIGMHPGLGVGRRPGGTLSARFGNNGTYVITAGSDSTVLISRVDGTELGRLRGHTGPVTGSELSPNGLLAATSATDTTARIWNVATHTVLRVMNGHTGELNSVRFNVDGTRVVTASDDSTACVWDVASGSIISRLSGHRGWVRYAEFSPDGKSIVTASQDGTAIIWDAATGSRRQTFTGHAGPVRTARFSLDGSRVMTVSTDATIRIWDIAERRIQEDMSDAFWTIAASSIDIRAFDLGVAPVGGSKDSVIVSVLCNSGSVPAIVRSISFSGGNASSFSLISEKAPYVLLPGECRSVEIRFAPTAEGAHATSIVVETNLRTISAGITGQGVLPLARARELVDFGACPFGGMRDTTVSLIVENISTLPVSVLATPLLGPDTEQFSILQGEGAFTLQAGESRTMQLRFKPGRVARTSGRIGFDIPGAPAPIEVGLYAEGTCASASVADALALSIVDTVSGSPGDTITVPVRLSSPAILAAIEPKEITVTIRVNGTVLFPVGNVRTISQSDTAFVFAKTVPVAQGTAPPVEIPLSFIVGLGDAEISRIDIRGFDVDASCQPPYTAGGGVFHLLGICREGGLRLFQPGPEIHLKPVRPDPVRNAAEVEVELMERGRTRLMLRDPLGRTMQTLLDEDADPGPRRIVLDAADLPSGAYMLVLETPTRMLHRSFKIVH